jgi:carbonic anhydrase
MAYDEIMRSARAWKESFTPNDLTAAPTRHLVVLACMDARLDLFRLLGLEVGHSHLLRNAGGRATDDAIRSIIVSSVALGTREVVVIHHTGCGLYRVGNDELRHRVAAASGNDPVEIEFLSFDDEEQSVREDVARIRACPYLPQPMTVWGGIYDVDNGELRVTVAPDDDLS